MKNIYLYLAAITIIAWSGCKKNDYAEGTLSPIIAVVDMKALYKGADVTLTSDKLNGAKEMVGVVISDATSGNAPAGVLVVQNNRRNAIRGIAIELGAAAANYIPGDSVMVQLTGATLTKTNGSMRLKGISEAAVTKVASGHSIAVQAVPSGRIKATPDVYESTLVTISSAIIEPEPQQGETYAGDKLVNDGFGKVTLHTEAGANFASAVLPFSANFTGIPITSIANADTTIQVWPRTINDMFALAVIKPSPIVIAGYLTDPSGGDANQEYIQLIATRDIDFAATNFSLVTCNNAGTNPAPANGWEQGGLRSYKINLTSGTVKKGQLFYVGGNKNIWGLGTTDISNAHWISSTQYSTVDGAGFGTATGNLLANSGNVAGMAIFAGITVDASSIPLDLVMYGGSGTVYSPGPPEVGYRITNTDYYTTINPVTRQNQAFYGSGTNTSKLTLPATGNFTQLGGVYDAVTGRWTTGRTVTSIPLSKTSALSEIETDKATKIQN